MIWDRWIAAGFGSGLVPKAPGTWGSAAALAFVALLPEGWWIGVGLIVGFTLLGWWVTDRVCRREGLHDPGWIVIDEWAGIAVATLGVPHTPAALAAAFILFRLFDIAKPWPVGWLDRHVAGAWGVMLDELAAGGMALGLVWLALGQGWLL